VGDRVSEQLTLHDVATQRAGVAGEGRGLWLWGILDWRNEGEEGPRAFYIDRRRERYLRYGQGTARFYMGLRRGSRVGSCWRLWDQGAEQAEQA
jgi:hypothetical protein